MGETRRNIKEKNVVPMKKYIIVFCTWELTSCDYVIKIKIHEYDRALELIQ